MWFRNSEGENYTWGRNYSYQLTNQQSRTGETIKNLQGVGIRSTKIESGFDHTLILGDDGTLYVCGSNEYGQLGLGEGIQFCSIPTPVLSSVVDIAAGYFHSLALTNDGRVYAWGLNDSGQLGLGDSVHVSYSPALLGTLPVDIKGVSCGSKCSFVLTDSGIVYGWGENQFGNLGLGDTVNREWPVAINAPIGFVRVASGQAHTLAVDINGNLWVWGSNIVNQLSDIGIPYVLTPQQTMVTGVVEIDTGDYHSFIFSRMSSSDELRVFGSNSLGQLGNGRVSISEHSNLLSFERGEIHSISCGRNTCLMVGSSGAVSIWGDNSLSQIPNQSGSSVPVPTSVLF